MNSMTGFGFAETEDKKRGQCFKVEISSVNRKQLDIRLSLPRELTFCEAQVRKMIASKIGRGSVFMKVELCLNGSESPLALNREALIALAEQAKSLAVELQVAAPDMNSLLALPGIVELKCCEFDNSVMPPAFAEACDRALQALGESRKAEGAVLYENIAARLNELRSLHQRIIPLCAEVPVRQKERLLKRLSEEKIDYEADQERLLREIVYFTDRSDVSEEIARLSGHFDQFETYLQKEDQAIGRSLDFMVQETGREINTLGNKALSTQISPLVVEFKTVLEKIREQIQNVE